MVSDAFDLSHVRRVVIYGADPGGFAAIDLALMCGWEIVRFVDFDKSKSGSTIDGYEVQNGETLRAGDFDLMIVSSMISQDEVVPLFNEMGFVYKADYIFSSDHIQVGGMSLALLLSPALNSGKRVIIFGTGRGGVDAVGLARKCGWEIVCFVDSNRKKWAGSMMGFDIKDPARLKELDFDFIIVASIPGKKAIFRLLDDMGFVYKTDYLFFQDKML